MSSSRKLYRDTKNGKIAGVCSGISEYLDIDVTVIRIIMVILAFTSIGIIMYIIMALIIDPKPKNRYKEEKDTFDEDPFAKYD